MSIERTPEDIAQFDADMRRISEQQNAPKVIEYTISLTVTRAIRADDVDLEPGWEALRPTADWMASREAKRELEKEVLQALRRLDGDCDCEVMEHQIKDE